MIHIISGTIFCQEEFGFDSLSDRIGAMFEHRLKKVQTKLKKENISALLITTPKNISYLTGGVSFSDSEREKYLLVTINKAFVFTDKRHSGEIKENFLKLVEITHEKNFIQSLEEILKKERIKFLVFEKNNLKYSEFEVLDKKLGKNTKLASKLNIVENLRLIKDEGEIRSLKKACKLTDKTFSYILNEIKQEVSEKELAFEMEIFIRKNGGQVAFPTIVAFGKNSAVPHHATDDTKLKKNSLILLDFGVDIEGYKSDMTRTVFFGKVDKRTREIYKIVFSSQEKAILCLRNKAKTTNEPAEIVDLEFKKSNFEPLIHGLGHGIGLDIHESPSVSKFSKTEIKPGMIFTIEPGIYINGFGGVRIEDDILIKKPGIEVLTRSRKDLIELKT